MYTARVYTLSNDGKLFYKNITPRRFVALKWMG